jgi:putative two-component system response regulator
MDFNIKPTVLIVEDAPDNLMLISNLLKDTYRVKLAVNGEKALHIAQADHKPDLILLDIMMPGLSGFEVCQLLKADPTTQRIPIIFLTALTATVDEKRGLELGAADFITKPVNPPILLARVATQLKNKAAADFLKDQNAFLESEVVKRTREVAAIQDVSILAMASLAETRDNETGNHIRRTQYYVKALAERLQGHPRFSHYLTDRQIDILFKSAPLHDLGKVGIPDRILLKPGKFEPDEFGIMKTHCQIGFDAIAHAEDRTEVDVDFLACAKEIAFGHHEKWDGSGYPLGIGGDDIPISARLMAIADVYDALISRRVYKPGMSHEQAVAIIAEGHGQHFDPDICDTFLAIQDRFRIIANRFADTDRDIDEAAQRLTFIAEQVDI